MNQYLPCMRCGLLVLVGDEADSAAHLYEADCITRLRAELVAEQQKRQEVEAECLELTNGPRCADFLDSGMLANRVEEDYPCTCITETTKFWDWHESALAHSQAREEELVRALEKINNFDPGRCMGDVACQLEEWVSHAKETIETALSSTTSSITTANPQDVRIVTLIEEGANVESARQKVIEAAMKVCNRWQTYCDSKSENKLLLRPFEDEVSLYDLADAIRVYKEVL